MRVMFKGNLVIIIPEDDADTQAIDDFAGSRQSHLLRLMRSGRGMQLDDLGEDDSVRNTPINITSN